MLLKMIRKKKHRKYGTHNIEQKFPNFTLGKHWIHPKLIQMFAFQRLFVISDFQKARLNLP